MCPCVTDVVENVSVCFIEKTNNWGKVIWAECTYAAACYFFVDFILSFLSSSVHFILLIGVLECTTCLVFLFHCFARVTQIKTHAWDNTSLVLVGNKIDLRERRVVQKEDGEKLGETLGMLSKIQPLCIADARYTRVYVAFTLWIAFPVASILHRFWKRCPSCLLHSFPRTLCMV